MGQSDNTVTLFVRDNMDILKYEICCDEPMNDTLYDPVHYRNIDVENHLDVKIQPVLQDGAYGVAKSWFETFATCVNANITSLGAVTFCSLPAV